MELVFYPKPLDTDIYTGINKYKPKLTVQGLYASKKLASSSFEFKELRNYTPQDAFRNIYWKAFAKTNQPMVKTFLEEKSKTVIYAFENSLYMLCGIDKKIFQQALEVAYWHYEKYLNNDSKISVIFNCKDKVSPQKNIPPRILRKVMLTPKQLDLDWNFTTLINQLLKVRLIDANVFIFTSGFWAENPHNLLRERLTLLSKKATVFIVPFYPFVNIPPEGIYYFSDPLSGHKLELDFSLTSTKDFILKEKTRWINTINEVCKITGSWLCKV